MSSGKIEKLRAKAAADHAAGDHAAALIKYRALLAAHPTELTVLSAIADIAVAQGCPQDAIEALSVQAEGYADDGLLLKAAAVCKQILAIDPTHEQTQAVLADLYSKRRKPSATARPRPSVGASMPALSLRALVQQRPPRERDELPNIPLFSALPKNAFVALVREMELLHLTRGDVVITEGEEADAFYAISSGRVRVDKNTDDEIITLAYLADGAFFGEMAFLQSGPRTASVTIDSATCALFKLSRELIEKNVSEYPSVARSLQRFYQERLLDMTMAVHPLFSPLTRAERRGIVGRFQRRTFSAGDVLTREGRPGAGLFVILSGRVEVVQASTKIASLGPGDIFGELALVGRAPAMATVRAEGTGIVLKLPRADFEPFAALEHVHEILSELVRERTEPAQARLTTSLSDPAMPVADVLI